MAYVVVMGILVLGIVILMLRRATMEDWAWFGEVAFAVLVIRYFEKGWEDFKDYRENRKAKAENDAD